MIDSDGRTRFLDEAFVPYPLLIDLEVDGYGPHLRDISRRDFADERRRDTSLEIIGWNIIRFSYDDVKNRKLECQELLRQWMRRWTNSKLNSALSLSEREIVKLALSQGGEVSLKDLMQVLSLSDKPVRNLMRNLVSRGIFSPMGRQRIYKYKLDASKILEIGL